MKDFLLSGFTVLTIPLITLIVGIILVIRNKISPGERMSFGRGFGILLIALGGFGLLCFAWVVWFVVFGPGILSGM